MRGERLRPSSLSHKLLLVVIAAVLIIRLGPICTYLMAPADRPAQAPLVAMAGDKMAGCEKQPEHSGKVKPPFWCGMTCVSLFTPFDPLVDIGATLMAAPGRAIFRALGGATLLPETPPPRLG